MGVIAAYLFENNGNDLLGNHSLNVAGAGPTYKTDIVFEGTYSYSVQADANYLKFPSSLLAALAASASWTIEGEVYIPSVGSPDAWAPLISMNWSAGLTFAPQISGIVGCYYNGAATNVSLSLAQGQFHFLSVQWSGTQVKFYADNTLINTINTTTNIFSTPTDPCSIGRGLYSVTYGRNSRIDRMVVSDVVRNGVPSALASVPTITNISPASGYVVGGETITITGTQFSAGASVTFGGIAATSVNVVSATSITCITPTHAAGAVNVVITNTDGGTYTLSNGFLYLISFAPTISSIYPNNGSTAGNTVITVTGTYFDNTVTAKIDGLSVSATFISATEIILITSAHIIGTFDVIITVGGSSVTLSNGFTFMNLPLEPYVIKVNGQDVTQTQTKRFLQKQELNIIKQYGLSSSNISITAPFDLKSIFYKNNNNDRVKIYKEKALIYTGYITSREKNYSKNIFDITCSPLFNILNKMEDVFTDTVATPPVARLLSLLQKYTPADYTVPNVGSLDTVLFPSSGIIINSNGSTINIFNTIIQLAEFLNIGIFIDYNFNIRLFPVPTILSKGKNINISDVLIESPVIKEDKSFYYDCVSIDYLSAVGGSTLNYVAGNGSYIKRISCSNVYFNTATAMEISKRTLSIYSKVYSASDFKISKTFNIDMTDLFYFDNFYFLCTYKEETLQNYIIKGIGIDSEALV